MEQPDRVHRLNLLLVALLVPASVRAQVAEPQVQASLSALDRLVAPASHHAIAARFTVAALGLDRFAPFTLCLADQTQRRVWPDAIGEARRLLSEARDLLVAVPPPSPARFATSFVPVRDALLERLRRYPPAALETFLAPFEAEAEEGLAEWRRTPTPTSLVRIVRELGMTRAAEKAADLLGDLAFERGDFHEALAWWGSPARGRQGDRPAALHDAKRILGRLFLDQFGAAERDLLDFKTRHGKAQGPLAGRNGPYAETLEHWLHEHRGRAGESSAAPWPTFAGAATRNRALPMAPSPPLWLDGASWRVHLAAKPLGPGGAITASAVRLRPIIQDRQVLVSDGRSIRSWELATGEPRFHFDGKTLAAKGSAPPVSRPTPAGADGRVYGVIHGALVCLATGLSDSPAGELLWTALAQTSDGQAADFLSDPLAAGDHVYVVAGHILGVRVRTFLCCYGSRRGVLLWRQPLGEVGAAHDRQSPQPGLLTWAGDRVVYGTDHGLILAIDPWTGKPLWRVSYPSTTSRPAAPEPLPAVFDGERVIVAPADSDLVLCIEARTGAVAWELPVAGVEHILGIADDMVLLATRHSIDAVDAATGAARRRWRAPDVGRLSSAGRGLVAGGLLFWPVEDAELPLRALRVQDGMQATASVIEPSALRSLGGGDLLWGENCLVVVRPDELVVFVPRHFKRPPSE